MSAPIIKFHVVSEIGDPDGDWPEDSPRGGCQAVLDDPETCLLFCTRPADHDGDHAAYGTTELIAVWAES